LLNQLDEWGIANNTLVIYLGSDNGGTKGVPIYNAGMREGKGSSYQGGTRVPCFFRWPDGGIPAGTESDALSAHLDIFSTFAEIVGADLSPEVEQQIEGRSLLPILQNPQAEWPDRTLVHHFGNWAQGNAAKSKHRRMAIQNSRFTLVNDTELYEVKSDVGEDYNVIDQHPEVVAELRAVYDQWWEDVQPFLINENLTGPKINPMKESYWEQFGGGPDEKMLRQMDPQSADKMSREIAARNEANWAKNKALRNQK